MIDNSAIFPDVWDMERFQRAKVTLKSLKIVTFGAVKISAYDFLLGFHFNYVFTLYLVPFPRYYQLFSKRSQKRKDNPLVGESIKYALVITSVNL